ncbi:MAG: hypothetical protein VYD53_04805 [Pseudomonadota bacterium]|jgi:FlaA1/EpsC-like NDP-sugar epimerase|uniref:FAD/NAD(P)-binding domain-containing protein n=1 Tax=Alteromonas oceani TaxID=2071609 RepID=A0ABV7JQU6_9ALTE|nr:hypothetical protein [Alteromonas oceani]MEC9260644.1 hypothetical protein [Pseudomonadota bacterium]
MKNVIIFGAGAAGARAYQHYKKTCKVMAFIDNDPGKQNTRLFGVDVMSIESASKLPVDHIYIASASFDAIKQQLAAVFTEPAVHIRQVEEKFIDPKSVLRTGWLSFFAVIGTLYLVLFAVIYLQVNAHAG